MLRRVGTLKTYSSLGVFVTENRPLSSGDRMSAPGRSMTPNGAYMPPPMLTPLWQLEQPLSINNLSPSCCSPESAFASPSGYLSNDEYGLTRVASHTAIAYSTLSTVIG